mgnify:CR=1 FL=1
MIDHKLFIELSQNLKYILIIHILKRIILKVYSSVNSGFREIEIYQVIIYERVLNRYSWIFI